MSENYKNLFLRQSYLDSYTDYERSLENPLFAVWDYVILSASNETQATAYRRQIEARLEKKGFVPGRITPSFPILTVSASVRAARH